MTLLQFRAASIAAALLASFLVSCSGVTDPAGPSGVSDPSGPDLGGPAELQDPGEGMVLHSEGTGLIEDISTGRMIQLPPERRIQIILAAEGYGREDLEAGAFREDVEAWKRDVFALEPLNTFREAFTLWTLAQPSPHLPRPGEKPAGPTPFRVQVATGYVKPPGSETAAQVWKAVDKLPRPPWGYYGGDGFTRGQARNVIVHILPMNPATGHAGYLGQARTAAHPSDSRRNVYIAIGQDQQHEFLHALANLLDEYHDAEASPLSGAALRDGSPWWVNVSPSRKCADLPWKHLLPGGAVNPGTRGLIGAFGAGGRYHPELKCLMNGTEDNVSVYGGNGYLRQPARLCNLCREITLFRLYERTGVLPDARTSMAAWRETYRSAFYRRFPLQAPPALPQRNSQGTPVDMPCEI